MTDKFTDIEINLNFRPSTSFVSGLAENFVEFVLWNRTQIPFTFDVLQKFVESKNLEEIKCFKKLKAVKTAKEACEKINGVKELTRSEINTSTSMILVLGSSIQTAKEAYKITLPSINPAVISTLSNESLNLRRVFLELIQSDGFIDVLEQPLAITNTFILFKQKTSNNENLYEVKDFKLNKSCKKFSIKFIDSMDFEVFCDDFEDLSIKEDSGVEEEEEGNWYQSKIFVKGFSETIVGNKSVWG